ncbi:MAG: hypothetical protein J0L84_15055, partial [Verrucomicrobia bacterium]|nr:hypothetical protein [Verrucomicrobiota bacterium]
VDRVLVGGDQLGAILRHPDQAALHHEARIKAYGTEATLEETRETAVRLIQERRPPHRAAARLTWYLERVRRVEPVPLGKQGSRDVKDDPCLAAALAAQARRIVSYEHDLLALGKPFGIAIVRPAAFLRMV